MSEEHKTERTRGWQAASSCHVLLCTGACHSGYAAQSLVAVSEPVGWGDPLKGEYNWVQLGAQRTQSSNWPEGSLQEWSGPQRWELSEISRKMFYRKSTLPTLYLLNSSWQAHVIKYRVSCRLIHLRLATRSWQSQQNQPMGTGVWLNSHKLT